MNCLTPEQLAAIALNLEPDQPVPAHVHECPACSAKLAELTQLSRQLSEVHAGLDRNLENARAELMARVANQALPARATHPLRRTGSILRRPRLWQRVAVGGLGLSAVAAFVLVVLAISSFQRASAMHRMIAKIREVTSFRYSLNIKDTHTPEGAQEPATFDDIRTVWWQAPHSLHAHTRIIKYAPDSSPGDRDSTLRADFAEILPTGKPGMIIDHMRRIYYWLPVFQGNFPDYSPVTKLRMVKDKAGEMVRDLGTKLIDGKQARGFIMRLDGAEKGSGYDALEVWVDPETDLPMEFGYDVQTDSVAQTYRLFDCQWNIPIDPQLFITKPPQSYTDTTAPKDQAAIDQIIFALRLYAELSGGHYPRVEQFDGDAIHAEMLRMAGFVGEPQEDWAENELYRDVQQATEGLQWLTRILRSHPVNAGYFGQTVDAEQDDKVLVWWMVRAERSYRVIYGDLQTEVLYGSWWEQLGAGQSPKDGSQ